MSTAYGHCTFFIPNILKTINSLQNSIFTKSDNVAEDIPGNIFKLFYPFCIIMNNTLNI